MKTHKVDTRTAIIEASISFFASEGFESTPFSQIAKKCKISQPGMYNHFANKMDLLNACALYAANLGREYIDQEAKAHLPALDRLRNYIHANLQWFKNQKKYGLAIAALYYFAGSDANSKKIFDEIQNATMERIKTILAQGNHESAWKLKDIEKTSWVIHSLLVGEIYKVIYSEDKKDKKKFASPAWDAIQVLLGISKT